MTEETDTSEVRKSVSDEEMEIAFSGPAPGVNRFFVTLGATGLRIAFVEEAPRTRPQFRCAVTMHPQDGIRLYQLLQEMLHDLQIKISELEAFERNDGE